MLPLDQTNRRRSSLSLSSSWTIQLLLTTITWCCSNIHCQAFQSTKPSSLLQHHRQQRFSRWTTLGNLPQVEHDNDIIVPPTREKAREDRNNPTFNLIQGTEILHFRPLNNGRYNDDKSRLAVAGSSTSSSSGSTTSSTTTTMKSTTLSLSSRTALNARVGLEDSDEIDDVDDSHKANAGQSSRRLSTTSSNYLDSLKMKVSQFINQPIVEIVGSLSVLLMSFLVAVSTLDNIDPIVEEFLCRCILGINVVFAFEFLARWFSSTSSFGKHFSNPLVLVDLIVIIFPLLLTIEPTIMGTLAQESHFGPAVSPSFFVTSAVSTGGVNSIGSALINLRLLYVLRLQRVLQDLDTFSKFGNALGINKNATDQVQGWQLQLARVLLSIFTLLSVAAGLIYTAEHVVNPNIDNYFDALYFGLTTLTTVGFGDIYPVTWEGKLIVEGSILIGVAVVPAQAAALVDALLQRQRLKDIQQQQDEENRKREELLERQQQQEEGEGQQQEQLPQQSMIGELDSWMFSPSSSLSSLSSPAPVGATCSLVEGPRESQDGQFTLLMAEQCTKCGASMHWSSAKFCWSCGIEL